MTASRTSKGWRSSLIFSTLLSFWFFLRVSTHGLSRDPVQPALVLLQTRPTRRSRILLRRYGPSLRLTPYALVAPLQERVDGYVVLGNVAVDPLFLHEGERRDLSRTVVSLPGNHPRARPLRRLFPPYPCHPRFVPLKSPLKRLYLPYLTAQVRRATPHPLPVTLHLLLYREPRLQNLQRKLVTPHHLLTELVGILEEKAGVYGEDGHLVGDLGDQVYKRHPLRTTERSRERKPGAVGLDSPLQDLLGLSAFEVLRLPRQLPRAG